MSSEYPNLIPPKKGEVRNPLGITGEDAGRPPKGWDYASIIKRLDKLSEQELMDLKSDPTTPIKVLKVIAMNLEALKGMPKQMEMMIEKLEGKVPNVNLNQEVHDDNGGYTEEQIKMMAEWRKKTLGDE